jgi:hypothetical protein
VVAAVAQSSHFIFILPPKNGLQEMNIASLPIEGGIATVSELKRLVNVAMEHYFTFTAAAGRKEFHFCDA